MWEWVLGRPTGLVRLVDEARRGELGEVGCDGAQMVGRRKGAMMLLRELSPLEPEDADDDGVKEWREGEFGNPMRMAVPWETVDSGRALFASSGSVCCGCFVKLRLNLVVPDELLRAVRPPDGRADFSGPVSWTLAERTQRSGAPYW